jgi:two-component system, NtrC family, response regulator AtoC
VAARKQGNPAQAGGLPLRFGCGPAALYYWSVNSLDFLKIFFESLSVFIRVHPRPNRFFGVRSLAGKICVYLCSSVSNKIFGNGPAALPSSGSNKFFACGDAALEDRLKEKILIVDDERLIRQSLEKGLAGEGYLVVSTDKGKAAIALVEEESPDLVLLDLKLPDFDGIEVLKRLREIDRNLMVLIMTAYGSIGTAIAAIRAGAYDYLTKPFDLEAIHLAVRQALEASTLKKRVAYFCTQENVRFGLHRLVGESPILGEVRQKIRQIAHSEASTVLLEGESGTGKDLVARTIHAESSRSGYPFVEVNCSTLHETLIESELFGHERGAFTDAKTRKSGLLELAHQGTLYLDEIGDMNLTLQAKLLSVIENKRFRRLGGVKDLAVDVRFISATNRNLTEAVKMGDFRQDLFYRLKVFPIHMPSLRERMSDLPLLIDFFLHDLQGEFNKKIRALSPEASRVLAAYSWPGNIRELRNVLERAFILCEGERIEIEHLPPELFSAPPSPLGEASVFKLPPQGISLDAVEQDFLRQALEMSGGNQVRAARLLGVSRDVLRYRMKKFEPF